MASTHKHYCDTCGKEVGMRINYRLKEWNLVEVCHRPPEWEGRQVKANMPKLALSITLLIISIAILIKYHNPVTYVRPEWFGAKANDAIDDSDAIQKAIDGAVFVDGCVLFGRGVYFTSGMIKKREEEASENNTKSKQRLLQAP